MKMLVLAVATLAVAGCQKTHEGLSGASGGARGRYVGVGIYSPGQLWAELIRPATAAADPAQATLADDEEIIVVLDSGTGELRQCGNLSGHCIGFNPWTASLAKGQGMPAQLLKHARDLAAEAEAEAARPNPPSPAASPRP